MLLVLLSTLAAGIAGVPKLSEIPSTVFPASSLSETLPSHNCKFFILHIKSLFSLISLPADIGDDRSETQLLRKRGLLGFYKKSDKKTQTARELEDDFHRGVADGFLAAFTRYDSPLCE